MVQSDTENILMDILTMLKEKYPTDTLYYAGGVALNVLANEKIIRSGLFKNIILNGSVKDALGIDFRACDNYKNGFDVAAKIKCPTINILGEYDRMIPIKEGKKLADLIEGSQVDVIDNCGHMMLLEEADRVLKVLKKFIKNNYPSNSN